MPVLKSRQWNLLWHLSPQCDDSASNCRWFCMLLVRSFALIRERQGQPSLKAERDDKANRGSGFRDKGSIPQYPNETSSTGPVVVTRFSHEFRLPDKAIVTWQVWGQARESLRRSRLVGFMARRRHGYTAQLHCSQGWEPYLKSKCQGKEGEPLLRLLSRAEVSSITFFQGDRLSYLSWFCTQQPNLRREGMRSRPWHLWQDKSHLNFQIAKEYFS